VSPSSSEASSSAAVEASIDAAYEECNKIAKREAKNFYYAFRVLPKHKRRSMCAIYAFMRRADDISDDETIPVEERRKIMSAWLGAWRTSTVRDRNPVFVAVRDTQGKFGISDDLLEELVRGTTMDLEPAVVDAHGVQTFETFDDLYRYCYLVASVVGLVCIRIFGYTDPRAELLAEQTGIAFQLTNILRDVKEDAERGRIYLPLDRLHTFKLEAHDIVSVAAGAGCEDAGRVRSLLLSLAAEAREYYRAAGELLPLIDADSRAALWVLVEIYSRLLDKIDQRKGNVFVERVRVSTPEKLVILGQGAVKSLWIRAIA
jgi:phytoene synthase